MVKFIKKQKDIEVFRIILDTVSTKEFINLINCLKNKSKLKSIEITPPCLCSNLLNDPDNFQRFVNVLQKFKGRNLTINGVPIGTILGDVDPEKIPNFLTVHPDNLSESETDESDSEESVSDESDNFELTIYEFATQWNHDESESDGWYTDESDNNESETV